MSEELVIAKETAKLGTMTQAPFKYADLFAGIGGFHAMLDQGVHLPPSAYEAWFVSASHDDDAVNKVIDALPAAVAAVTSSTGTDGNLPA